MTDEQMLTNVAQRCQECFALLFGRHFRSVLGIAFKILHDKSEAEDILQEVFLAIYLQQERFDPAKGSVRTWILQFAYFKSLLRRRYLSIRRFYQQEELSAVGELRAEVSFQRIFGLNASDLANYIEAGLAMLPAQQRQAIELVHFEGRTLQEISELIGTLGPEGRMELTVDNSFDGYIEPRHALHAARLALAHPITGAALVVDAPLPDDIADFWASLKAP